MKAADKFTSHPPGRLESHPAHEEVIRGDPFSTCVSSPNGARGK